MAAPMARVIAKLRPNATSVGFRIARFLNFEMIVDFISAIHT
jgi:hypothetical protein